MGGIESHLVLRATVLGVLDWAAEAFEFLRRIFSFSFPFLMLFLAYRLHRSLGAQRRKLAAKYGLRVEYDKPVHGRMVVSGDLSGVPVSIEWRVLSGWTEWGHYRASGLPRSLSLRDPEGVRWNKRARRSLMNAVHREWLEREGRHEAGVKEIDARVTREDAGAIDAPRRQTSANARRFGRLVPREKVSPRREDLVVKGYFLDRAVFFDRELRAEMEALLRLGCEVEDGVIEVTVLAPGTKSPAEMLLRRFSAFVLAVDRARGDIEAVLIRAADAQEPSFEAMEVLMCRLPLSPAIQACAERLRSSRSDEAWAWGMLALRDHESMRAIVRRASVSVLVRVRALKRLIQYAREDQNALTAELEPELLDLLAQDDRDAQYYAAVALANSGTPASLAALKARLERPASSSAARAMADAIARIEGLLPQGARGALAIAPLDNERGHLALAPDRQAGEVSTVGRGE